jgi:hypothetical protein
MFTSLRLLLTAVLFVTASAPSFALPLQTTAQTTAAKPTEQKSQPCVHKAGYGSEGERIFAQNCSRCHATPDGFSTRISGTVVRHMRVRASLSKHDEQELLRFFNP